jgi:formylglycine-generating enzyme required for sulfatase activity
MPSTTPVAIEQAAGWPFDPQEAKRRQGAAGPHEKTLDLGGGVAMKLVRIPAGEFVMGDTAGKVDECPPAPVAIKHAFWIGAYEVTNEQYYRFDPEHSSGAYYPKRHYREDDPGLPLDRPAQPVVRVSWERAMAFCRWLSEKTGLPFTLPTEAQWEYACRAGAATPLAYGTRDSDFSRWANVGDKAMSRRVYVTGGIEHLYDDAGTLCDVRFNDHAIVTTTVGHYRPNVWGLYDMHGNAAEWTRTAYSPYPYKDDDGRNDGRAGGKKVVRGGSFYDRPQRCRSAFRLSYPAWQRVFNVGFRVVIENERGAE